MNFLVPGPSPLITYNVSSTVTFIDNVRADIVITDFTITPASGRYLVFVNMNLQIVGNPATCEYVIYVDGSFDNTTRRSMKGQGANFLTAGNTMGEVFVDGTEAIDVRINTDFGNLIVLGRIMELIRIADA